MKELLTEWRKFVNESYSAEFSEEDIAGTLLAADTITNAIDGGTQIDYDRYEGSSWSREMGTVSAKARQLKRSFQGVDDPVQLADDMATFGEWIEKSFRSGLKKGKMRKPDKSWQRGS